MTHQVGAPGAPTTTGGAKFAPFHALDCTFSTHTRAQNDYMTATDYHEICILNAMIQHGFAMPGR